MRIFKSWIIVFVLTLSASACSTYGDKKETLVKKDQKVEQIRQILDGLEIPNGPGVALSIVYKGDTIFMDGVGLANIEHGISIDKNTVFEIGSVSKQFTAFAVLLLEAQDKLSLDDDIKSYLPELPEYGVTIKIRHLLYHTSGLREWLALSLLSGWGFDIGDFSRAMMLFVSLEINIFYFSMITYVFFPYFTIYIFF